MSLTFSFQWLSLLLVTFSSFVGAMSINTPRLSPLQHKHQRKLETQTTYVPEDFQTFYYTQTLDHFNYRPESYATFQQRYVINFKYWGGPTASAPIFAYLGAEAPLDDDLTGVGFLTDNAVQFNALLVYIEHRYYGKSVPSGSVEKALKSANLRGYFNSAQALADYAAILLYLKEKLLAQYSPVIVIGGSYGGMLASWFRLKYPHVALGALASSAPILNFDNITPQDGYFYIVTKDFREASETCYQTIKQSWSEIDKVASQPNGLSILSTRFKTCTPLQDASELKDYLKGDVYAEAAQYDRPPTYPVTVICNAIDGAAFGSDILGKIFAGVVAHNKLFGNSSCYVNPPYPQINSGWTWQSCSDMVMPQGTSNNTMFPADPFNLTSYIHDCKILYGVLPRPHWITTYYGGHDIKLILKRFGSNIIFSNGLRDPYSIGGVLENISDTILAIYTNNGSHALDILPAQPSDPEWLVMQRKTEVEIIKGWISRYYDDLLAFKH